MFRFTPCLGFCSLTRSLAGLIKTALKIFDLSQQFSFTGEKWFGWRILQFVWPICLLLIFWHRPNRERYTERERVGIDWWRTTRWALFFCANRLNICSPLYRFKQYLPSHVCHSGPTFSSFINFGKMAQDSPIRIISRFSWKKPCGHNIRGTNKN